MANYRILTEESTESSSDTLLVAVIDGATTLTLSDFYSSIALALKFPDYFGHNLDSFDEMINDLGWIQEKNIHLIFKNYDDFLTEENDELREILLTMLDDAAMEKKSKEDGVLLEMSIEPSELAADDLETIGIEFI
ncbi:MAG: barstar family protein [Spirosomataceae bacterium]|jgi:RNAse (barnase) inhibitor barstar